MNPRTALSAVNQIPEPSRLFRVRAAAALAGLNKETINRRIRAGQIPAYGFPRRVNLADLLTLYEPKTRQK